jgi:hypothetical protein
MKKIIFRGALLLFVLSMCSSAFSQQRWLENGTTSGTYKRIQLDDIAFIFLYNTPKYGGAHIYTYSDGKYETWGDVPRGSTSLVKLKDLIKSKREHWIQAQPQNPDANGAFFKPNEAVAYVDINRILTISKAKPNELGQEAYVLAFEKSNVKFEVAVIDPTDKARLEKMFNEDVNQ